MPTDITDNASWPLYVVGILNILIYPDICIIDNKLS